MNLLQLLCAFCALVVVAAAFPTDGVIFPNHRLKSPKGGCGSQCPQNAIPVSLAKQLSNIDSSEQFLRQFVENGGEIESTESNHFFGISLKSPFPQSGDTHKRLPPANCKPEVRTVSLRDTNDPTVIYYPMCVRLEQCGGCCNHELLGCQPLKSSLVNVTVMMTKYVGNKTLKYTGKKTVTLSKHEQCACDCKTKPQDCRGAQIYKKEECRCVCANENEEKECATLSHKLWNPSTCQCNCREEQECSTGYIFDDSRCNCIQTPQWRSYNSFQFRDRI